MSDNSIHVYFMPGMAANISIFENIQLPQEKFVQHYLDWVIPTKDISLEDYALEMCQRIAHPNPVLIGVSFGGILVQEMAKHIPVRKVIIISSVKTKSELPKRMIFAKYTKLHKLLPTGLVNNVELMSKYAFGEMATKRLALYERYLSVRDKYYLDWSIDKIVNWNQTEYAADVIHIHGEKDPVFPFAYIKDCIPVKNGTHTMIIHRYKWFNEHLPSIILQ
ncbi:alpha/beta fold hydrolase [Arenibacter certesii]|uniref:Alpha/beta hydrolase n=1 Tax=Arenibacter certesii TaxID=228955 RepID=A0A918IV74_9FLAO|nr:alpha/beta hydrolase [Arenibacter certesii]GGW32300.1 alpha/beta hydrolase [Arenibacter certesii]